MLTDKAVLKYRYIFGGFVLYSIIQSQHKLQSLKLIQASIHYDN